MPFSKIGMTTPYTSSRQENGKESKIKPGKEKTMYIVSNRESKKVLLPWSIPVKTLLLF
jgi:hypothetical protein